jgi:hypothetical protein
MFRHTLAYKAQSKLKIQPERLEISIDPTKETTAYAEVSVETSGQSLHVDSKSSDLSPFFLLSQPSLTQISNLTTRVTYLFGVHSQPGSDSLEGTLKYPTAENVILLSLICSYELLAPLYDSL